jgi:hypothetical protein
MFGFGAGFVLTQFGLRSMPPWLGVAISIPTSTLLFWCLAPFFVNPPNGNLKAVALFACIGLFFPGTVALLHFESNGLMGPNIAGALSSIAPVFAIALAIAIVGAARLRRDRCWHHLDVPRPSQLVWPVTPAAGAARGRVRNSRGHSADHQIRL